MIQSNNKTIDEVIEAVVNKYTDSKIANNDLKYTDSSGIIKVNAKLVTCKAFGDVEGVYLKDLLTLGEAPRMGAGVMEVVDADFEWTLRYDEYDYVVEGKLEILVDDRRIVAEPGEIIYIPRNSHIHFKSTSRARYVYFVYPANWQEI